MKKYTCLLLCLPLLLSGCVEDDVDVDNIYGKGYKSGYKAGFEEGVSKFRDTFDEEIAPSYDWMQETLLLYTDNVCIIDDVHNKYHSNEACWDMMDVKTTTFMFIDDAEAEGYSKCSQCYKDMEYVPMPDYDELTEGYEPEDCPSDPQYSWEKD